MLSRKNIRLKKNIINVEVIENLLKRVSLIQEQNVPFPQADYFPRIINLCELSKEKLVLNKEEIAQEYKFSLRQAGYYSGAAIYLGLIERKQESKRPVYQLSERGVKLFELPASDRKLELIELVLVHQIFNETLKLYFGKGAVPSKEKIIEIMRNADLHNVKSGETYARRSLTVLAWIKWIISLVEE